MDAKVKNHGEVTVIEILGPLEIEQTQPFREACLKHFLDRKLVFNMEKAAFVGSTGLQAFLETVKTLSEENRHGLKLVGLKPEFRRIFYNLDIHNIQIHETNSCAVLSFQLPNEEITVTET